jgi:hypothetical protein
VSWEHIWISEGFTTYFAYVIMETLFPHIEVPFGESKWYQFLEVMNNDGRMHSPSVYQHDVTDAMSVFNIYYVYTKGAAMVDLIQHTLGEEMFRNCIRMFLTEYKYKSASFDSFFKITQRLSSGLVTPALFQQWLYEKGYPIIQANHTIGRIILKSYHFKLDSQHTNISLQSLDLFDGMIPVSYEVMYTTGIRQQGFAYHSGGHSQIYLNSTPMVWYRLNIDHLYYRVIYDKNNWEALQQQAELNSDTFSIETLQGFMADVYHFVSFNWMLQESMARIRDITCAKEDMNCYLWWTYF